MLLKFYLWLYYSLTTYWLPAHIATRIQYLCIWSIFSSCTENSVYIHTYAVYVACIEMEKSARKIWKMKGNQENNFNKTKSNVRHYMRICISIRYIWERCTVKHYGLKINNLILENGAAVWCGVFKFIYYIM